MTGAGRRYEVRLLTQDLLARRMKDVNDESTIGRPRARKC
jgi:hypothetical protein